MPLSPPTNGGELLQHNLHHVLQHNSNTSFPQDQFEQDDRAHLRSNYGSPVPSQNDGIFSRATSQPRYQYQPQYHEPGLKYEGYNPDFSGFNDQYSTPATSPPTPLSSQDMLQTRSGLTLQRGQQIRPKPDERSRVDKSPRPKKVKKEKIKGERISKMEKPLTELTKDFTLQAVNIEAYVNRSAEVRRKEVENGKIPGKVKRPMNSFMLYRKCYQKRANAWCLENNHQIISQICGESWPLEPEEVREQFNEWARLERINHQNAHPGYKFSPTKPGQVKSGKRKVTEEPFTEESDLDDYDWQGGSGRRQQKKPRPIPPNDMPVAYPSTRSAYHYSSRESSLDPIYGSYHPSSYQATNPGKHPPAQYRPNLQGGEYYQQTIRTNPHFPPGIVEDVLLTKQATPGGMHNFLGLPGGQDFDIMGAFDAHQFQGHHVPDTKHDIDPSLMSHGQVFLNDNNPGDRSHDGGVFFGDSQFGEDKFGGPFGMIDPTLGGPAMTFTDGEHGQEGMAIHDPHMNVLRGHQDGWHVESMDAGPDFNKWMDGE